MISIIKPTKMKKFDALCRIFNDAQEILREGHKLECEFKGNREKINEIREITRDVEGLRNWADIIMEGDCCFHIG